MIPWVLIDTGAVPGGQGELRLMQRGTEFSIMVGANELMNSRKSGSEEALAELALGKIPGNDAPRVLIGGLGMGFTLRAALAAYPLEASIVVAELVPSVIEWARGPLGELYGSSLSDPRVAIRTGDVATLLAAPGAFDVVLLDVDNGPEGLTRPDNDRLYSAKGLALAKRCLRQGGVLAIWSAHPSAPFTRRLVSAGFKVEEAAVKARGAKGGSRHHVWLALN